MFETVFHLILIYVYLVLAGAGIFLLLAPSWLQRGYAVPFVVPTLGFALITALSMYLIRFRYNPGSPLAVSLVVALILLAAGLLLQRDSLARIAGNIRNDLLPKGHWVTMLVAAVLVLFVVLSPGLRHGSATVPFRAGPDQIQNVLVAQFFLEGGTLDSAESTDSLRLDTIIVKEAVEAMRWGVSWAIAANSRLTDVTHPYRIAFLSLTLNLLLLGGLTFFLLYYLLGISPTSSLFGAIATVLNCNLLNLLYEGFWAQVFTAPVFLLTVILLLRLRAGNEPVQSGNNLKSTLLLAFLLMSLATTYTESMQTFLAFYAMVSFLDLILFRRLTKSTPMVLASLGITLFCLIPAMPLLGRYYLKLLPYYLKIGGFWQPHWALPSEIVGFSDIYRNFLGWYGPDFVPKLISRTWTVFVFNLSLSIAIVGFFFTQIFRRKGIDRSFWLAAPVFVLLTFLTCFFEGHHNYPYMKSYTLFMPLLFCAFYDGFHHTGMTGSALLSRLLSCSKYIVILMIVLVGLFHVQEYSRTSSVVNEDMYELQELFRKVDLSNKVFLPRDKLIGATSPDQRHQIWQQWLLEMMILPLFPVSKIDEQRLQDQNFQPHLSKEVYLILKKQDLPCYPCTAQKNVGHIVWENGTFLIVATGKTLREGFSSNSGGKIDLKVFWSVI